MATDAAPQLIPQGESEPVPVQVERLRAEFELEKQHIANRGQWFGASIGVLGALAVAAIGLLFRPPPPEPIPPSKRISELEEQKSNLTKQVAELSRQLNAGLGSEQELRAQVSTLNKQLGEASATQQQLNAQIKQLEGNSKSSPQTLLTLYAFSWKGTVEDCRERAANGIGELKFKRMNTSSPEVVAGNAQDIIAVLCASKNIVVAGSDGEYIQKVAQWLQVRMEAK